VISNVDVALANQFNYSTFQTIYPSPATEPSQLSDTDPDATLTAIEQEPFGKKVQVLAEIMKYQLLQHITKYQHVYMVPKPMDHSS